MSESNSGEEMSKKILWKLKVDTGMVLDLVKQRKFPTVCRQNLLRWSSCQPTQNPGNHDLEVSGRLKFRSEEIIPKSLWLQEMPSDVEGGGELMDSGGLREGLHTES